MAEAENLTLDQAADSLDTLLSEEAPPPQHRETDEEVLDEEEVEAATETVESETEPTEDPEDDVLEIGSIEDVMSALDIDPDFLDTLTYNLDGQPVPFSDFRQGNLRERDYRSKTESLAQQRREFEQFEQERRAAIEASFVQSGMVVQSLEQQLQQDMQNPWLQQLQQDNWQAWQEKQVEFQQRAQLLYSLKTQAAQQYAAHQEQSQSDAERRKTEAEESWRQAVIEAIPGWGSAKEAELRDFLSRDYGFTAEEMDLLKYSNPALTRLVHDAMRLRTAEQEAKTTEKRVRKAPPKKKATGKPVKRSVKRSAVQKARQNLRKSGHVRDAAAFFEASGMLDDVPR